jgi:transcriptional regulator with XRE-family HTH domain
MMNPCQEIGARIRRLRKRRGLSVAQLASTLDLTDDAVRRMERGENVEQFLKLIRLSDALLSHPNEILGQRSSSDRELLQATLEACFQALGLSDIQTNLLAETIVEVLEAPEALSGIDRPAQARLQSFAAVRALVRAVSSK